jgi:hypothetical protein
MSENSEQEAHPSISAANAPLTIESASRSNEQASRSFVWTYTTGIVLAVVAILLGARGISTRWSVDDRGLLAVAAVASASGAVIGRLVLSPVLKTRGLGRVGHQALLSYVVLAIQAAVIGIGFHVALAEIVSDPNLVTLLVSGYALLFVAVGLGLNIGVARRLDTSRVADTAPAVAERVEALLGERLFGSELDNYDGWIAAAVDVLPAQDGAIPTLVVSAWLQVRNPRHSKKSERGVIAAWERVLITDGRPARHASFTLTIVDRSGLRRHRVVRTDPDQPTEAVILEGVDNGQVEVYVAQSGRTVQVLTVEVTPAS